MYILVCYSVPLPVYYWGGMLYFKYNHFPCFKNFSIKKLIYNIKILYVNSYADAAV